MACIEAINKNTQVTTENPHSPLTENLKIAQTIVQKTIIDLPIGAANTVNSVASRQEVFAMRSILSNKITIADHLIKIALICLRIYAAHSLFVFEQKKEDPSIQAYSISVFITDYLLKYSLSPTLFDEVKLRLTSHIAKYFQVGNCAEHAFIALEHLKKTTEKKGEVVADFANDHAFLVIDRDPNSSISDPKTWGERAVICDPWARQCFQAYELKEKLANILTTYLFPPQRKLNQTDFEIIGSYKKNILVSYLGNIFSNVACADLYLESALKNIKKNLEGLKELASKTTLKKFPYLSIQAT